MKDPISEGNAIFCEILAGCQERITDINEAFTILEDIVQQTEGWVIVDFLDNGCWDRLTRVEIDQSERLLYLIESEADPEGMPTTQPPYGNRDGLIIRFKDLVTYSSRTLSGVFLRGYHFKKNEIKRIFSSSSNHFKFDQFQERNFALSFERNEAGTQENFDVLNSPIFSIAIIPKNVDLRSSDSQVLLFALNFHECLHRLESRKEQLLKVEESDEDSICEKVNTGRRIFESVLKVECCLIWHKVSFIGYEMALKDGSKKLKDALFDKEYDKLMLGDLKSIINDYKPENRQKDINNIISGCNKLSHDSGAPISKGEAIRLMDVMISYTTELTELIRDHSLVASYYTENLKKREYKRPPFTIISLKDI